MPPRHTDFRHLIDFGNADDCWEWSGTRTPEGYGRLGAKWAHRLSYEHFTGPIPKGFVIRHKCDNPPCCNPNHLETGTHAENVRDSYERQINPLSTRPWERLNFVKIKDIRENPHGRTVMQLAVRHHVHGDTVLRIQGHR